MKAYQKIATSAMWTVLGLATLAGGCCWPQKTPTPPLGAQSDAVWRRQEAGASAADFVIYQSEFAAETENGGKVRLNAAGEDHLRSIAARLHGGAPVPVVIERSSMAVRPDSKYQYPIHADPELDMRRREYVAKTLVAMGVSNADQCVVVAPAFAEGYTSSEAARAYAGGISNWGGGRSGTYSSSSNVTTGIH